MGTSPRGSVTDDTWAGSPVGTLGSLHLAGTLGSLLGLGQQEPDVPSKTRRTAGRSPGELHLTELRNLLDQPGEERGSPAELFLPVPSHFSWNKSRPGNPPLFRPSSPPPADWPLPCQWDGLELQVEVEPRGHHRAHYETEGSRGAIKAAAGGHPTVKLLGYSEQPLSLLVFIGTADERSIRPHAFYQVHRVTGKTVTTACQERLLGNAKVLEIPLLPENNMAASIDCAGILKLRNADIELKKGETDIGRKNTRVRVVFRVGVPQPGGQLLCLQTASVPIECSQRSAQELPQVESFSPASCCMSGGEQMIITGSNISPQSRVIFMEKGPDGRSQWEVDVKIVREKSSGSSIVVEIPPYHDQQVHCAVQVQFYVSNGKRRRSLSHSFSFLPGGPSRVKQEQWDKDYTSHNASVFCPDMAYYDPCGYYDPSQHLPLVLQHPRSTLPDSNHRAEPHRLPFQLDSQEPELFSAPPQTSSVSPRTSKTPLQSFPHASTFPHHTSSAPAHTFSMPPQTSSVPPRTSCGGAGREKTSGEALSIKQEEEEPSLQEITLDDLNEIIDRDIGFMSQSDQFQLDWEQKSSDASPFCQRLQ